MALNLKIDCQWFDRSHAIDPSTFREEERTYERLKYTAWAERFHFLSTVKKNVSEFEENSRPAIHFLKTILKVIQIITVALTVAFPMTLPFFPVWASLGIAFPSVLVLNGLNMFLRSQVEIKEQRGKALLYLRQMLKNHSFKALHPFGLWDLPPTDPRLRSDRILESDLNEESRRKIDPFRSHVGDLDHVANRITIQALDLEMSRSLEEQAASSFAQFSTDWRAIQKRVKKAKEYLRQGNRERYQQLMSEAYEQKIPLKSNQNTSLSQEILPILPAQDQVRALLGKYFYCYERHCELERLHEEGKRLFGGDTFYQTLWDDYLQQTGEVKEKILGIKQPLFDSTNDVTSDDWLLGADSIQQKNILNDLIFLSDLIKRIKVEFEKKIRTHPEKRLEAFEKECARLGQRILAVDPLLALGDWIDENPDLAECPAGEVIQNPPYSREIARWLEEHPELLNASLLEIYERNYLMRYELQQAARDRREILKKAPTLQQGVEAINKKVMIPLRKIIRHKGEPSLSKRIWRTLRKLPACPFDPVIVEKDPPLLRNRKVEELVINDYLKKNDRHMVLVNRIYQFVLNWGAKTALGFSFLFFRSNPWVVGGICAAMLSVEGGSYFIDRYLQRVNSEKQGFKFHMLFRDYPDISRIAGTSPRLQELSDVQHKYNLAGVTRTWSRVLAEGEGVVLPDTSLPKEELKKLCKKLAEEGSQEAQSAANRYRLRLANRKKKGATSSSSSSSDTHTKTSPSILDRGIKEYDRLVKKRCLIEKELDRIFYEKQRLEEMRQIGKKKPSSSPFHMPEVPSQRDERTLQLFAIKTNLATHEYKRKQEQFKMLKEIDWQDVDAQFAEFETSEKQKEAEYEMFRDRENKVKELVGEFDRMVKAHCSLKKNVEEGDSSQEQALSRLNILIKQVEKKLLLLKENKDAEYDKQLSELLSLLNKNSKGKERVGT